MGLSVDEARARRSSGASVRCPDASCPDSQCGFVPRARTPVLHHARPMPRNSSFAFTSTCPRRTANPLPHSGRGHALRKRTTARLGRATGLHRMTMAHRPLAVEFRGQERTLRIELTRARSRPPPGPGHLPGPGAMDRGRSPDPWFRGPEVAVAANVGSCPPGRQKVPHPWGFLLPATRDGGGTTDALVSACRLAAPIEVPGAEDQSVEAQP